MAGVGKMLAVWPTGMHKLVVGTVVETVVGIEVGTVVGLCKDTSEAPLAQAPCKALGRRQLGDSEPVPLLVVRQAPGGSSE